MFHNFVKSMYTKKHQLQYSSLVFFNFCVRVYFFNVGDLSDWLCAAKPFLASLFWYYCFLGPSQPKSRHCDLHVAQFWKLVFTSVPLQQVKKKQLKYFYHFYNFKLHYWILEPYFVCLFKQDGLCTKETAPSVSSISRVLRGSGHSIDGDMEGRPSHSIDGILGRVGPNWDTS